MQNAYGAERFGGWMNEGLIWFIGPYTEVKADREKNDGVVEQITKTSVCSQGNSKENARNVWS